LERRRQTRTSREYLLKRFALSRNESGLHTKKGRNGHGNGDEF
jgi:hypothetical protein